MEQDSDVTVNFGPFKGCSGKVLSETEASRIVVQVTPRKGPGQESRLIVELDRDMVAPTTTAVA